MPESDLGWQWLNGVIIPLLLQQADQQLRGVLTTRDSNYLYLEKTFGFRLLSTIKVKIHN